MQVRVYCKECGNKARITSSECMTPMFSRLYCSCLNVHCGHTFVMHLGFSHSLRPPAGGVDQLLFDRLRGMPEEQRRELIERVSPQPRLI